MKNKDLENVFKTSPLKGTVTSTINEDRRLQAFLNVTPKTFGWPPGGRVQDHKFLPLSWFQY